MSYLARSAVASVDRSAIDQALPSGRDVAGHCPLRESIRGEVRRDRIPNRTPGREDRSEGWGDRRSFGIVLVEAARADFESRSERPS